MENEKKVLLDAVREAGAAILKLQETGFSVTKKSNHDLLTEADLLANHILHEQLLAAFPADGWLSEETVDDASRLHFPRIWIVDPIDGTREYAEGIPEYAISVALVEAGVPVLAAVFNPATDELFHARKGKGAWLGKHQLSCTTLSDGKLSFLASRSEFKRGEWDVFRDKYDIKQIGSIAYKLALIAAGEAHATFSLGPKSEWDIAAGVLLVKEAGGVVTDKLGQEFVFNQSNVLVNGIVACASDVNERVFGLINQ
jgi:myo-inositol-1(or 4)-monophosphatase